MEDTTKINIKKRSKVPLLPKQQKALLYTLLFVFFVLGTIYSGILPLWEGFDEPAHFAYIQHLAENKEIPVMGQSFASEEVMASIKYLPLNWNLGSAYSQYWISYPEYWSQYNSSEPNTGYQKVVSVSPSMRSQQSKNPSMMIWEAQQPPLYYFISVPVYFILYHTDLFVRAFALRLFSILLVTIALFISFKTICELFDDLLMRFGTLMFIVFNPMFMTNVSRISNESLAILLYSLFLYLIVIFLKSELSFKISVLLGIIVGLGILTKQSFISAAILIPILAIFKYWQGTSNTLQLLKYLATMTGFTIVIGSGWYIRNIMLYNNFSGLQGMSTTSFDIIANAALSLPWLTYFNELFMNYWGLFGWSFIRLSSEYYIYLCIIFFISILGLLILLFRQKKSILELSKGWKFQSLVVFAISIFLIFIGMSYINIRYFILTSHPVIFTGSWYSFVAITAEATLFWLGINAYVPKFRKQFLFLFFVAMVIFNITILFFYLLPVYYWGVLL